MPLFCAHPCREGGLLGLAGRKEQTGRTQAVTDGVHDVRFRSCSTRNGAEERGLSAHVVFRRRKKERGLSAHVVASFLLRVPQQLQPGADSNLTHPQTAAYAFADTNQRERSLDHRQPAT